jgi:hypothetical protein
MLIAKTHADAFLKRFEARLLGLRQRGQLRDRRSRQRRSL